MNITRSHGQVASPKIQIALIGFWIILYLAIAVGLVYIAVRDIKDSVATVGIIAVLAIPTISYFFLPRPSIVALLWRKRGATENTKYAHVRELYYVYSTISLAAEASFPSF